MPADWARSFYNSSSWEACRQAYGESVFWICEDCGAPGDICHHVQPLTQANINDPLITMGWDNLRLLCIECHNRVHKPLGRQPRGATRLGFAFDERGDLVPAPPIRE